MMVPVFVTLFLALLAAWMGWQKIAVTCMVLCLALSAGLFLFEVYSPEYGFRMPWIQTLLEHAPPDFARSTWA